MKVLVLGGTAFLGREIVRQAVAAGHEVTSAARGQSGAPEPGARWVALDRDQPDGHDAVAGEHWDVVLDVSRHPGQVRRAAAALTDVGHVVFVSTGNVYADTKTLGLSEESELLPPLTGDAMPSMEQYGEAKVACEHAALDGFGSERVTIARAGLIGGPGDWSGRTGYWPWRFAHPSNPEGDVVVPDALDAAAEIVDVRDLAAWLLRCGTERIAGIFNATGPTTTLGAVIDQARSIGEERSGRATQPVLVPAHWLSAHEVNNWMGPTSLPLWIDDPDWAGFNARDSSAAVAAGLGFRPLRETLIDTLDYEEHRPVDTPRKTGLTDEEERDLLRQWASESGDA